MINIRSDKEFTMDFNINVEGSNASPEVRFVFEMSNGVNVSFPGFYKEIDKKVHVDLPSLNSLGLFEKTENINAKLEVIVENSYFTPWQDTISIKRPMKVYAEAVENTQPLQETVSIDTPTITYQENDDQNKFSPVERLKQLREHKEPVITEEVINGVLHRKIKK